MNLAGMFALGLVGSAAAKLADRNLDQYAYNLKVSDTRTVKITPGAMLTGVALVAAAAAGPGTARAVLASIGIGGGAIEGGEAFAAHVAPMIDGKPAGAVAGLPGVGGAPALGAHQQQQHAGAHPYAGNFALKQAMLRWGRAGTFAGG
jgi:hypothetical protein